MDQRVAVIAFFALGANLLGTVLLLLLNPANREVRWYSAFQLAVMTWLLTLGIFNLAGRSEPWVMLHLTAISFLPGLFLATALAEKTARPRAHVWRVAAMGIPVSLLMYVRAYYPMEGIRPLLVLWQIIGWGAGSIIMMRGTVKHRATAGSKTPQPLLFLLLLMMAAPFTIIVGFIFDIDSIFLFVIPLATVVIQFLVFVGVTRMKFYDIDIRVARTGAVAAQAAESARLAVLGELAATIAHEVRNPLTGVRSLTQRIATEDLDLDKRQRYANVILDEVGRLERIVGNLLGVAKRSTRVEWNGEHTAIQPLLDDLVLLVQSRASARDVTLRTSADAVSAAAPRESLAQALLNLIINAINHAPPGTDVSVNATRSNGHVDIRVRDAGAGVPQSSREQIFEPFYSENNGTGLGLSVVRSIARELEWEVTVGDAAGGGAEFVIRIPDRSRVSA